VIFGDFASNPGDSYGAFFLKGPNGQKLKIIASEGEPELPWEHVSISLKNRCPTWDEMEYVKRLFWDENEWAMQLHAPPSKHISVHPYCLHIWRPLHCEIPIPPAIMVA
jgi:hypothetical protein